jgi:hypothetical protein
MDEKDDDKKRVLTPPSEWADGLKPKSSTQSGEDTEIDESTDWLEDDDFEVPPSSEASANEALSVDDEPSANEGPSAQEGSDGATGRSADVHSASSADAILTDHGEAQAGSAPNRGSKLPWVVAVAGFVIAGGMGGLWLDSKSTATAEIAELKDTIRSLKRSENQPSSQDSDLIADNAAFQLQISELQKKNTELADENEALKDREAERAQRAIAQSTKEVPTAAIATKASASTVTSPSSAPPNQSGGLWFVNLESHKTQAVANERLALLRNKIPSMNLSIASAEVKGQTYYRVRAAGFISKLDASMASKWAAEALNAGPFWIGKDSEKKQRAMSEPKTSPKARVASEAPSARVTAPGKAQLAKQPVRLRSLPMRDNWFVFVDTYDSGQRADEVISTLNGQGLDAKVAVESRSGELFYRVQIVGIENETTGNTIVSQLRADAFKNARLRKTVN